MLMGAAVAVALQGGEGLPVGVVGVASPTQGGQGVACCILSHKEVQKYRIPKNPITLGCISQSYNLLV